MWARWADREGMPTTNASSDASQPARITLDRNPGQLLAAIPHLMGFHPAESVVLVGLRPTEPSVIGWLLRGDLPPDEFQSEQAAEMAARLALSDAFGATIVVIGGNAEKTAHSAQLPYRSLVGALTEACRESRLRVLHSLWVPEIRAGVGWQCYEDPECRDVLPDPACSAVAATMATAGRITFDSREDLAGLLTPDPPEDLERRSVALDAAMDRIDDCDCAEMCGCAGSTDCVACGDDVEAVGTAFDDHCATVGRALVRLRAGQFRLADTEVVHLALALSDVRVRDACLSLAVPPGSSAALTAESLWIALVRATPAPERAEPAALVGYSAYLRGDGALADIALRAALRASPEHVLAGLLERALWKGVTPEQLEGLGRADGVVDLWQAGGQE